VTFAKVDPSEDRFIRGIIRRKVKQLIGCAGIRRQDRQDLEHDLFLRVLQCLPLFDPERAHCYAFITCVVERQVANILRDKRAEKRDQRRISSLNVMIGFTDERPIDLAQLVSEDDFDHRIGRQRLPENELVLLRVDLATAIGTLPERWQTLLELRKTQNMSEAARVMGVRRTTLNAWMSRIRRQFEKAGMREYLK
jgi:RNA polymerase sigma factor (sigma-70 family)